MALPEDEPEKTTKSLPAKRYSSEYALLSESELDEPAYGGLFRQMQSDQHASRKDLQVVSNDSQWTDQFSDAGAKVEKMGLELSGPYFAGTPLELVPDKQFKPPDGQFSRLLPRIAKLQSPKELGIKTTTSLVPRELISSFDDVQLSGDRVITARYTVSTTPNKSREYAIEVYDVVTDAVVFSVKHVTDNTVAKLDVSSRLLVVIEYAQRAQRSIVTVYERISDKTIETSTASLSMPVVWTEISDDNSKIALWCPPDETGHNIVFLKGKATLLFKPAMSLSEITGSLATWILQLKRSLRW